jgi:hypothetical protein
MTTRVQVKKDNLASNEEVDKREQIEFMDRYVWRNSNYTYKDIRNNFTDVEKWNFSKRIRYLKFYDETEAEKKIMMTIPFRSNL